MPISNFPGGFSGGVSIQGIPVLNTYPGQIFWVCSVIGSNGNNGKTKEKPFATIDYAIGKCTASKGDVILVMPGHTETITGTSIVADIAGISVIGLGNGSLMPQIKHNHADAEVSIAADNVLWQGIRHSADVTGVKVAIEIEDGIDYCTVRGCKFDVVATTTDEFLATIRTNDESNYALIEYNDIDNGLGGAVEAIAMTKDTDATTIRFNRIQGDYSTACINGTTTLSTNLDIQGNLLMNGTTGNLGTETCIELVASSTGVIRDNLFICNVANAAAACVADTAIFHNNYYAELISDDKTSIISGATS